MITQSKTVSGDAADVGDPVPDAALASSAGTGSFLTGRTRYRIGLLGAIIVQVEVSTFGMPAYSRRVGRFCIWRDACALDLQDLLEPQVRDCQRPPLPTTGSGVMKPA